MNCLDFRRRVLVDPRQADDAQKAHAAECAACDALLERQRELEASLYAALQVPAPDGLADRILVARGLRRPQRWTWAAAASVVVAGALALAWPRIGTDPLAREAIAHVAHEPQAFSTAHAVAADLLPNLLSTQGMALARTVGQVTYSVLCPMADGVARHLVVRTPEGAMVTLLLLPDDGKARTRAVVERGGMAAVTLPAARGSIAIVAATLDQALAMEQSLRRG